MSLVQGWGCRGQEVAEPPVDRRRDHHPPLLTLPLHPTLPLTSPHPPTWNTAVLRAQGELLSHPDSCFGSCWQWCFAFLLCWFSENPDFEHEACISLVCCTSAHVPASATRPCRNSAEHSGCDPPTVCGHRAWPVACAGCGSGCSVDQRHPRGSSHPAS